MKGSDRHETIIFDRNSKATAKCQYTTSETQISLWILVLMKPMRVSRTGIVR